MSRSVPGVPALLLAAALTFTLTSCTDEGGRDPGAAAAGPVPPDCGTRTCRSSATAATGDSPVHERAAMVLHKIREAIGDDAFFGLLKGWATARRHGNAGTADFTAYAEEHAEKTAPDADLTPIREEWLYGEGKPGEV